MDWYRLLPASSPTAFIFSMFFLSGAFFKLGKPELPEQDYTPRFSEEKHGVYWDLSEEP
ncbi:hypothetical protein GP475_02185 [Corynebacterium poyangense]|uniref:Uncharacterized protein n=1 Tax=Corynebacterium poyangense TaxID=2684405 RepID=A0A7H0SLZ7_9CORY|nr:hypothetical protein [Corynebacterium poyangense]MBZ8177682.1 hypothetical protein [Corynebacterium poyangense]QNQ89572.1 hypothetical protein GP475_02185 [Corynebacterium poyangense]